MNALNLLPSLLLGLVVGTAIATVGHLMRGHTLRDLLIIWLIVQAGFWLTALLATLFGVPLYTVGGLQLIAGVAGGVAALALLIVTQKRV